MLHAIILAAAVNITTTKEMQPAKAAILACDKMVGPAEDEGLVIGTCSAAAASAEDMVAHGAMSPTAREAFRYLAGLSHLFVGIAQHNRGDNAGMQASFTHAMIELERVARSKDAPPGLQNDARTAAATIMGIERHLHAAPANA